MPEFIPEHIPSGLPEFERGYFAAAEWLLPEIDKREPGYGIDRNKIRGWSREAIKKGCADCINFQHDNAADLALYYELRQPRGDYSAEECAGHDFWLSRNGHGSGFFDRGNDPVFDRLQDAARRYSQRDVWSSRGWLRFE